MAFDGGDDEQAWVPKALWGLHGALLVAQAGLSIVQITAGPTILPDAQYLYVAPLMFVAFGIFLYDLIWLRPGRIRRSGIPATTWERAREVTWAVSAAVLLPFFLAPGVMLFYAFLRSRLVGLTGSAIRGTTPRLTPGGGLRQAGHFVAIMVGWAVLLAVTFLLDFILELLSLEA